MKIQRFTSFGHYKRKYTFGLAVLTSASLLFVGCSSDIRTAKVRLRPPKPRRLARSH